MWYFPITVLLLIGGALYWIPKPPRRRVVRASRPEPKNSAGVSPHSRWWLTSGFAVDQFGNPIKTDGRFVGTVCGESMVSKGLPNGATFVADYLKPDERRRLQPRDIVVVRDSITVSSGPDETRKDEEQFCLRSVRRVKGNKIEYDDDQYGKPHAIHGLDHVVAIVTRVIPAPARRSLLSLIAA